MNYSHAYHAGNFADLVKHAALIALLDALTAEAAPLIVVDTHAGAGAYDLSDPAQARSGEAERGIKALLDASVSAPLSRLVEEVRASGEGTYPGSPVLICRTLRPRDRYVASELRPDVHAILVSTLKASDKLAEARLADGFATAPEIAREGTGRLLLLIDPPFERADDYVRIVATLIAVREVRAQFTALLWLPLKDLETLDSFVRRLEAAGLDNFTVCETRLRALDSPLRMNGCVMVAIGAPPGFEEQLNAISRAVVDLLAEPSGGSRLWRAGGSSPQP